MEKLHTKIFLLVYGALCDQKPNMEKGPIILLMISEYINQAGQETLIFLNPVSVVFKINSDTHSDMNQIHLGLVEDYFHKANNI